MPTGVKRDQSLVRRASIEQLDVQTLYQLYFQRIHNYVTLRISHPQDVEDIVSDIFVNIIEGLSDFKNRYELSFVAWAFTITRNTIIDFYRHKGHPPQEMLLEELFDEPALNSDPHTQMIEREMQSKLHKLVDSLPDRRREAIKLKYFEGLRNLEIAVVMGIDEHTVASHLSRGLNDLHKAFSEQFLKPT